MTVEEAIKYGTAKLDRIGYQLEVGMLNPGLRQINSKEYDFLHIAVAALRAQQAQKDE